MLTAPVYFIFFNLFNDDYMMIFVLMYHRYIKILILSAWNAQLKP